MLRGVFLTEKRDSTRLRCSCSNPFQYKTKWTDNHVVTICPFSGGEGGMALLRIALACPPKCFAFRYRTAHQHAKNDYQSFSLRALPPRGSNPILIYTTKNANIHDVDICVFPGGEGGKHAICTIPDGLL